MATVKFLVNPTPVYKLCYGIGDEAELPDALAQVLVEDKAAEYVDAPAEEEEKPKAKKSKA